MADSEIPYLIDRDDLVTEEEPAVLRHLKTIYEDAKNACGSAPAGMAARWAQEYVDDAYTKRQVELGQDYAHGHNNAGGVGLNRILYCHESILKSWKGIAGSLPEASGQCPGQEIYKALDKALDEYWALLRRTAEGLRLEGTQRLIGGEFRTLLESQRDAFNLRFESPRDAAAPELVAELKWLGEDKQTKVQEWINRTGPKLEDAIKAAKGN